METVSLTETITRAMDECIENGILEEDPEVIRKIAEKLKEETADS